MAREHADLKEAYQIGYSLTVGKAIQNISG